MQANNRSSESSDTAALAVGAMENTVPAQDEQKN